MITVQELIDKLQKIKDKSKEVLLEVRVASVNEFFDGSELTVSEDKEGKAVFLNAELPDL